MIGVIAGVVAFAVITVGTVWMIYEIWRAPEMEDIEDEEEWK